MRVLLTFILSICFFAGLSQDQSKIAAIVAEGKKLYRSEMASWYGTDVVLEHLKEKTDHIGGYFSYEQQDSAYCLFFTREETPKVLAVVAFDSTYKLANSKLNTNQRDFTRHENDIYIIRKKALAVVRNDTLFKTYKNSSLNLIPLITGNEKKVYILTGPSVNNVVIFGNDYLLTFDANNNLNSKRALHKNIIPINAGEQGQEVVGTMHSHLEETGDYITATDICTLMLYSKFTKWQQHIVISKKYISIWDCKTNQLAVLTKEAWDKINKN